jgi:hypothetical protein
LERRKNNASTASSRRVEKPSEQDDPVADLLPNLAAFLDDGEITLGIMEPIGPVAVASDGSNTLAMLRRRKNETFTELLARLDYAIGLAVSEDIFTDEINTRTRP